MMAALTSGNVIPAYLVNLTLTTGVQYLWSGPGSLTWNGNTYMGIGSMGEVGTVSEGSTVSVEGTTLKLSGVDMSLVSDTANDIQIGAPVYIYFGFLTSALTFIGEPYELFGGCVDKPTIEIVDDADTITTITITLALENNLINLSRPTNKKYTTADQHLLYPDDSGFSWVESLNDTALRWG
jgi:hypothetical protein